MKRDYDILGLPETAGKDVVEKKYGALIRQYKARTDEHGVMDEDAKYYQEITDAYNRILGKDPGNYDDNPTSVVPYKIRRFGGKLATLIDQYKGITMVLLVVIIAGAIAIIQGATVTEYDLNIKVIGAFNVPDITEFSKQIGEKSESVDLPAATFYTITTSSGYTPDNYTAATQFQAQLIGGELDIIFMDHEGWEAYRRQKAFYRLDDLLKEEEFAEKLGDRETIYYEREIDKDGLPKGPESGIYAIDITDTTFFKDTKLAWLYDEEAGQKKAMYVAICGTTKNLENAKAFLSDILDY